MNKPESKWTFILAILFAMTAAQRVPAQSCLVSEGVSHYQILIPEQADIVERFAAEELQKYLALISGATLEIAHSSSGHVISVGETELAKDKNVSVPSRYPGDDGFRIQSDGQYLILLGANPRGTLYAVYSYLERLGCRWYAPSFEYYNGKHEYVPKVHEIALEKSEILDQPDWRYRIKDIDQGRALNAATGKAVIEWMGKNRVNILAAGIPKRNDSYKPWNVLRTHLLPELEKRGISVELGKHNVYNLCLPPWRYFSSHPEWYGTEDGEPKHGDGYVFSTANQEAVKEFVKNVLLLIKEYPEMRVFQFWPPDYPWGWSESPQDLALGSITDRHAMLVRTVAEAVKKEYPKLGVQFLAYHEYVKPPTNMSFPDNTRMDFCPIGRSYQDRIYGASNTINARYNQYLKEWTSGAYKGDVVLYSYYAKYIWHSLPVVIPNMISDEIRYYDSLGLKGMSMYCVPANWFTYEVNHYLVARASWDTSTDPNEFMHEYCGIRFGGAREQMLKVFTLLEEIVPAYCSVPRSFVDSPERFDEAKIKLRQLKEHLRQARSLTKQSPIKPSVSASMDKNGKVTPHPRFTRPLPQGERHSEFPLPWRERVRVRGVFSKDDADASAFLDMVEGMVTYASMDIDVQEMIALKKDKTEILAKIGECEDYLKTWQDRGIVVTDHIGWLKKDSYKKLLEGENE